MAADNVKTAFRLPSGVYRKALQKSNMAAQKQQWHQKNSNQQQQNIWKFKSGSVSKYRQKRPVLQSHFNKVSGLQAPALSKKRLQHKCFLVKLLRTRFLMIISGRLLPEGHNILLKTLATAISNDISEAYYQKGFVIYFLRSTYSRFMEFFTETYNKGFSCSWIFSASWALPNA